MLCIKYFVLFANILFVFAQPAAENPIKTEKRADDTLQTYVIEPSNDLESDVTTIFPPLVEGESNSVSSNSCLLASLPS